MYQYKIPIIAIMMLMAISACNITQSTTSQSDTETSQEAFQELADLLRKEPGVTVKGNSPHYAITIRGKQTFNSPTAPLYVIDGIAVGTDYAQAAHMINITDVASINVLKGSEATSWGSRGANGVIEIKMKRGPVN